MKKHFKNHRACEHDPGHEYSFSVPTVCVLFVFHIIFCRDNGGTPSLTLLSISFLNICCSHYLSKIWSNKWAKVMDHQLNEWTSFLGTTVELIHACFRTVLWGPKSYIIVSIRYQIFSFKPLTVLWMLL